MWLVNRLPEWLKWRLWKMVRSTYLVGVLIVVFHRDQVLIVKKKRGLRTGYLIPGGGKKHGMSLEQAALDELAEETGLTAVRLGESLVFCNEPHHDISVVYPAISTEDRPMPEPKDTFEIERALFVPSREVLVYLTGDHKDMMKAVMQSMQKYMLASRR